MRNRASCSPTCRRITCRSRSGLGEASPLNVIVLPGSVRRRRQRRHRARLASSRFSETHQSFLNQLSGIDRYRAQHDRREHAHRRRCATIAACRLRLQAQQEELKKTNDRLGQRRPTRCVSRKNCCAPNRTNCGRQVPSWKTRRACSRRRTCEGGSQEPRSRTGKTRSRRKGRTAGADLQVQVGIPGQYEPRVAHASEQPARSFPSCCRENTQGNLDREAGRIRPLDPSCWLGFRFSVSSTTFLDPVQDRDPAPVTLDIGETSFASLRDHMDRTFSQIAQDKKLDFDDRASTSTLPRAIVHRRQASAAESSRTCCPNAFKFTGEGHASASDRARAIRLVVHE